MNVIVRLEYELAYYDSTVHRFNHYTMRTTPAFDRVDHSFLKAILSVASFGLHFHSWKCLLYVSPRVIVEVNRVRLRPITLTLSIHQGCLPSLILYILALEPFLCKLRANPVLFGLIGWLHRGSQVHCIH